MYLHLTEILCCHANSFTNPLHFSQYEIFCVDQITVNTEETVLYCSAFLWSHNLNTYCLLPPVNTYHVPSPSSSTGRATCARVWRSPSTSLHTTSQNTTSASHRPPSHQYKVTPRSNGCPYGLLLQNKTETMLNKLNCMEDGYNQKRMKMQTSMS